MILTLISSSVKSLINKILYARQERAYESIAKVLLAEYPFESYDYVLHMLREGKTHELNR